MPCQPDPDDGSTALSDFSASEAKKLRVIEDNRATIQGLLQDQDDVEVTTRALPKLAKSPRTSAGRRRSGPR
ncbi:hypothetical protein [Arthrobacter oryzae]|uniref:hypothetical protein n=1 Tax=Arthrobacter oryzae TaxID=409290 RepID=UPI0011CDC442|nr:hypothetical protein [Arthrobacter oryzae]